MRITWCLRISGWASSFVIGVVKSYHTRTVHLSSKEGKVTKVPYFSSSERGRGREREREGGGGGKGRGGARERGEWEGYVQNYSFKKGSGQLLDNRGRDKVNRGWQRHQERSEKKSFNERFNSYARVCQNFVAVIYYKVTLNRSGLKILRTETPTANYCVQRRENAIPEFSRFSDLIW